MAMALTGCGGVERAENSANQSTPASDASAAPTASAKPPEEGGGRAVVNPLGTESERRLCQEIDTGDSPVLASQTFAINFEPFIGSCFVTTHNPEFDDPPLDSEFAIYRKDEKIFDFPGQFNGTTSGCWVVAVGFQDLNADGLIDVIVVGKCSAKTAPYYENMVYLNTGKAFTTREDANTTISNLTNLGAIADHVKANREVFFRQP
jgi:hypothetical protein